MEKGELPEKRLDEAVSRLIKMKYDQGLYNRAAKISPEKTYKITTDKKVIDFSWDVAKKAQIIMRDDKKLLPLNKKQKILVIEQKIPYEFCGKDPYMHMHMFCERMVDHSENVILVDTEFSAFEEEIKECLELAKQADIVVMTNYYARIVKSGNNQLLAKKLKKAGHKIVVVTNNPYVEGTTDVADAVICNFSGTPDSIRSSVDLLFGTFQPRPATKVPVTLDKQKSTPEKKLKAQKKKGNPLDLSYC
ncbi:MAG: glycoside hydrolase family 3 C-terminal domain-containing protein [bacterium]